MSPIKKYKRKVEACCEDLNVETNAPITKQIVLSDSFQCEAVEINSARSQLIKNSFVPIKIINEESPFVDSSVARSFLWASAIAW